MARLLPFRLDATEADLAWWVRLKGQLGLVLAALDGWVWQARSAGLGLAWIGRRGKTGLVRAGFLLGLLASVSAVSLLFQSL
jgi:hypothetical protein